MPEDTIRLAMYIRKTYGLDVTTPKAGGRLGMEGHLLIYIRANSISRLNSLVKPFIHKDIMYKLA